jgi:ABC-type antimicrobial peptide transport system permease subunit
LVQELDPGLPVYAVSTMEQLMGRSLADRRVTANIFLAFGLAGLLLAAIGVFGVTAHAVQRRTREIGVRMALGAEGRGMIWMVLAQEARTLGVGLGVGLLMALAVTKVISARMYQVSAFDPLAYGTTLSVLGVVGLVAVYLPARRAARVDPISALRAD